MICYWQAYELAKAYHLPDKFQGEGGEEGGEEKKGKKEVQEVKEGGRPEEEQGKEGGKVGKEEWVREVIRTGGRIEERMVGRRGRGGGIGRGSWQKLIQCPESQSVSKLVS